jgi:hypothetical protein
MSFSKDFKKWKDGDPGYESFQILNGIKDSEEQQIEDSNQSYI